MAAVKALVQTALPGADVLGLNGDDAAPARVSPLGRVVVRSGDPGDPEIDLSPVAYNWEHRIPLELSGYQSSSRTSEEIIDDMLSAIGRAIAADRQLGGLCDWVDTSGPLTEDIYVDGARPPRGADVVIIAAYQTDTPLN